METKTAVQADGVDYSVGRTSILRSCRLGVARGESVAVMGRSGTGKSTLLWLVMGLLVPDSGSIQVAGEQMAPSRASQRMAIRRRHIGAIFQDPELIEEIGVDENVALPLMLSGVGRQEAMAKAAAVRVSLGVQDRADIASLSGGERQRVSIARALVQQPALVVADEPTASLDEQTAQEVMTALINGCRAQEAALLVVTHDSRVAAMLDRNLVLRDGALWDQVTP